MTVAAPDTTVQRDRVVAVQLGVAGSGAAGYKSDLPREVKACKQIV